MSNQNSLNIYFGIIIVMSSFITIAGAVIIFFIRYHKKILAKQKEFFLLEAQYKKELLSTSIQSAEDERLRIAKDIHDEIGSIFSTLSLSIGQFSSQKTVLENDIINNKNLIQLGINSVRRISHGIIPLEIELLGLQHTIKNYFDSITSISEIEITFDCTYNLALLNKEATIAVYRIMQELLSNCIKHAFAKKVIIQIYYTELNRTLAISYKDDGIGLNLYTTSLKKGIGLKNIESRTISLDGEVTFDSKKDEGFNCHIIFPINNIAI